MGLGKGRGERAPAQGSPGLRAALSPAPLQGSGEVTETNKETQLIGIIAGLAAFLVLFILIMTLVLVLTTRRYHASHPVPPSLSPSPLQPSPPSPAPSPQLQEEAECHEGAEGGHDAQPHRGPAGSWHPRDQPVQR